MSKIVVCGGLAFDRTPVEVRERVAFREEVLPAALTQIRSELGLDEAVLISTCNRVEYFGVARSSEIAGQSWPLFLQKFHQVEDDLKPHVFQYEGELCVSHLFELASGLKSMVVGETEIFGQVKDAYAIAQKNSATGKILNRLFQSSFAAAKEVRSLTQITRGSVSVGSVAVELAEKIFGRLKSHTVMILGAGEMSERTARFLQSRGVSSILVANRTYERAAALAEELKGKAVRWEEWEKEAAGVDIMISSTNAPHYVLTRDKLQPLMKIRKGRPLFLIDLSVPRNFEPNLNLLDDVYLYDIDDLQSIAQKHLEERAAEVARSIEILKPHVTRFSEWLGKQLQEDVQVIGSNIFFNENSAREDSRPTIQG